MATEIERRFFVKDLPYAISVASDIMEITQGYLMKDFGRTLRIRKHTPLKTYRRNSPGAPWGQLCFKTSINNTTRKEYEFPSDIQDAEELLEMCGKHTVEKTRYWIRYMTQDERDPIWELDVFHGKNEGLVLVEIELEYENEIIDIPDWVGEEITDRLEYTNSSLAYNPYCNWK